VQKRGDRSQTHGFRAHRRVNTETVDRFHRQYPNPYINFHRPCTVPEIETEPNGKWRCVYREWATPFEIFSRIPQCESYLRPAVSMADRTSIAQKQSDSEAAIEMQEAKRRLMAGVARRNA
jgi:hypothetical protein